MSEWTYHAQNAVTSAWIHRDLPLRDTNIEDVLSGHGTLTCSLAPEDAALDGLLIEWATFIYAEKSSDPTTPIRFGGIYGGSTVQDDGETLAMEIRSFSSYPDGQPYTAVEPLRMWGADATDVYRALWTYFQAQPSSNIGITVDPDDGAKIISDPEPPPRPNRATVTYRTDPYPDGAVYGTPGAIWPRPPRPRKPKRRKPRKRDRRTGESQAHWDAYLADFNDRLDNWNDDYDALNKGRLKPWRRWNRRLKFLRKQWEDLYGDREPYKANFWDTTDIGAEMLAVSEEGEFEWRERHSWTDGSKTAVAHRIQIGVPRIGMTHATTLTLTNGLAAVPTQVRAGDAYANTVMMLGKGEGRKQRRVLVTGVHGRLARTVVVVRKKVKRLERLTAFGRDQRSWRSLDKEIPEIAVWETVGTLGTYRLGDTVNVQVDIGWWNSAVIPCRIVGRRYAPDEDDLLFLQTVRAERSAAE